MGGSPSLSSHASFVLLSIPFFFFLLVLQFSLGSAEENWNEHCAHFRSYCGELNVSYPFSQDTKEQCGLGIINCMDNSTPFFVSEYEITQRFELKSINYSDQTIVIHDQKFTDFIQWKACDQLFNFTPQSIPTHLSFQLIEPKNITFQICKWNPYNDIREQDESGLSGIKHCGDYVLYYNNASSTLPHPDCKVIEFPVDVFGKAENLLDRLFRGFRLKWHLPDGCHECDGTFCLSEQNGHLFCAAPTQDDRSKARKIKIVVISSFIFTIILATILVCYLRRKLSSNGLMSRNTRDVEAFLRNYGSLVPKRYNYSDIKKMTNYFKEKLGQGGYGGVFKGKLPDGRLVAVKVLNATKGNGNEFINEVASISRTSHIHIVTLLGFCFHGSKKALIYEFMSNGSLEKFIYNKNLGKTCTHLGWDKLHQIAIGIAKGLEYLHSGCNTRILHFDIKPHNILLDEDFCPKISDFGLAKLCPRKNSIISMADARGTIGYIAPEVFSRNFGGVSHKSDVYSYGMMVLEMVGGRKNIDAEVDHTSEIYFPHWIYEQIGQGEHLQLDMVMREEEEEIAKKMVIVGLWCIQMDPMNRPSISKVVDMLEGNLESLPIPPKPFLSSPPRQLADSFTRSSIS